MVFDPFAGGTGSGLGGWRGAYVSDDFHRFERIFWANVGGFVVIDEAADVFREYKAIALPMLTRGRHVDHVRGGGGHSVMLCAQRWTMLDKSAREQASHGFVFRVSPSDADDLAEHFTAEPLREACELPALEFLACDTLGNCQRSRLSF